MTSTLGQNNNNGGVVGPTNNAQTTVDQTTEITATGTFSPQTATADILLVGGGSTGGQNGGGGGGAGGAIYYPNYPMPGSDVPVVIGAGGPPGNMDVGTDSTFNHDSPDTNLQLIAERGGAGGTQAPGQNGGSGGGGGHGGTLAGGTATQVPSMPAPIQPFGYGSTGGDRTAPHGPAGAGGGGAGGPGGTNSAPGGAGKDFSTPDFSPPFSTAGVSGLFAGGGAGYTGSGGPGGGGSSQSTGTANTGGGGGGGSNPPQPAAGGGSGVCVIREQADAKAIGVWDMKTVYFYRTTNGWPG